MASLPAGSQHLPELQPQPPQHISNDALSRIAPRRSDLGEEKVFLHSFIPRVALEVLVLLLFGPRSRVSLPGLCWRDLRLLGSFRLDRGYSRGFFRFPCE